MSYVHCDWLHVEGIVAAGSRSR